MVKLFVTASLVLVILSVASDALVYNCTKGDDILKDFATKRETRIANRCSRRCNRRIRIFKKYCNKPNSKFYDILYGSHAGKRAARPGFI